jgi:hypothetical protein
MAKSKLTSPVTAKKSHKDGHIALAVRLKCRGWNSDHAKIEDGTDITAAQARELASSLIEQADKADAKVAAKAAHEERRRKWREREIAAGRIQVVKYR